MAKIAAKYFGLPADVVFFADHRENGCIYLNEQRVFDELFPFKSATRNKYCPELHVVLRRNMDSINIVNDEKELNDEVRGEVAELEMIRDAKIKADQEKE